MKKLPIGIQTFSKLIEEDCYYVDKTPLIAKLAKEGSCYFLSRPRRFGKSLLVSTLASAFAGEKDYFKGLYLENNWDWSKQYPVVLLSFAGGVVNSMEGLTKNFRFMLKENTNRYGVKLTEDTSNNALAELIQALHNKTGQKVVVLVDEYDKPILDTLDDTETALLMREELRNIYSVLKQNDAYLKFVLLTGVSKFSKISLFSGLNNLEDISLNPDYATLCGYTETEIKQVFPEHSATTDFQALRGWYNGYNFLGDKVYNPFGILLYFKNREFKNYWFETGSPTFLLKLIKDRQYYLPDIENIYLTEADLGSFDVNDINLETVLFQTGYLTITQIEDYDGEKLFHLSYPNREVKASLNRYILQDLVYSSSSRINHNRTDIRKALKQPNFQALEQAFNALFASIPNDWYRKNQLSNYEGYYASIVYSGFCALGLTVKAEDSTNHGRIDLTVMQDDKIFIIEFKVLDDSSKQGTALAQIKAKNYQQKYLSDDKQIFLIGMEFDKDKRNLSFFESEVL